VYRSTDFTACNDWQQCKTASLTALSDSRANKTSAQAWNVPVFRYFTVRFINIIMTLFIMRDGSTIYRKMYTHATDTKASHCAINSLHSIRWYRHVHWDKCYHNLWNSAGNVSLIHTFAVTIHPSKRQLTFSQLVHQTVALLVPTINTACIQCSLARELQVTETTILNHSSVKYNVMYSNVNVMYSNVLVSDYARDCGILCTIFKEACCWFRFWCQVVAHRA